MTTTYHTILVGLFGDPVDGNPTGAVMNAGFEACSLNYHYISAQVKPAELENAINGMRTAGMRGVNLTMPHKVEVLRYLDQLTPAAAIIGAVNTIVRRGDMLIGENTDGKGFVRSLTEAGIDLNGKTITLLGAGGAAKAIAVECALAGAGKLHVINRNEERGLAIVMTLSEKTNTAADYTQWNGTAAIPQDTDILINATCVGLYPDNDTCPDIDYGAITPDMIACDVVFNPAVTAFMKRAEKQGAKVVDGLGMLANQAAQNFELWTDVKAPRDIMISTLRKELGQ